MIDGLVKVEISPEVIEYMKDYLERYRKGKEEVKNWKLEDFNKPFTKTPWWKFEWVESKPVLDKEKLKEALPTGFTFSNWFHSYGIVRTSYCIEVENLYTLVRREGSVCYLNREALETLERVVDKFKYYKEKSSD